MKVAQRGMGNDTASGYYEAMKLFDNHTWVPTKNTWTDNVRTEYRNRFN